LYLDSDFPTARRIVLGLYGPLPERLGGVEEAENPKGRLQELVQPQHGNQALRYVVTQTTGEDHAREFEVAVFLLERPLGTGRGPSKKIAEEAAARVALGDTAARPVMRRRARHASRQFPVLLRELVSVLRVTG
jgi:ribonuclease-3